MGKKIWLSRARQVLFSCVFFYYAAFSIWSHLNYDPTPIDLASAQEKWKKVEFDPTMVRDGDLLTRRGKGFISEQMMLFSKDDPKWSHSGIISKDPDGTVYVYHAIGGEDYADNSMKRQRIEIFAHPDVAYGFGVYRYDLNNDQFSKLDSILERQYRNKVQFDLDWDLESDEEMYCSELIYKALIDATGDKEYISLSKVMDKDYVAVDNLYLNKHCNQIFEYNYE